MESTRKLIGAALESDDAFKAALREVHESLGITSQDLAKRAGISPSTLYKIANEGRSPSIEVLRKIVRAVRDVEGLRAGSFVAIIAAGQVLDEVEERSIQIEQESVRVREYPATTVEDAIIAAIRAERDGAIAIVCAPIVSSTIEKIVDIPIARIIPRGSVTEAVRLAAKKTKP
jgi:predicted transcriptional regulator